jgi:hypothetical protein
LIPKRFSENLLCSNTVLECLDLAGLNFGDPGISALATTLHANHSLTSLNVAGTRFGEIGLTTLAQALKVNKGLCYIDLSVNSYSDKGMQEMAECLVVNHSLVSLLMSSTRCSREAESKFVAAIKGRTDLVEFHYGLETREQGFLRENKRKFQQQVRMSLIFKFQAAHSADQLDVHLLGEIFVMAASHDRDVIRDDHSSGFLSC